MRRFRSFDIVVSNYFFAFDPLTFSSIYACAMCLPCGVANISSIVTFGYDGNFATTVVFIKCVVASNTRVVTGVAVVVSNFTGVLLRLLIIRDFGAQTFSKFR